jgi:hypothetical protein
MANNDNGETPIETAAVEPPSRPTERPDVIEKGWDLVDTVPPPKSEASPASPPATSGPQDPPSDDSHGNGSGSND